VIYIGACPNQHLLPLFEHMLPVYRRPVYLTGANCIWGWEMSCSAREIVTEAGGELVGERCLPIGDTDVDRIVAEVAARQRALFSATCSVLRTALFCELCVSSGSATRLSVRSLFRS